MLLKWKRNQAGKPILYVREGSTWKHYTQAEYSVPDGQLSTQSGFHTSQQYLKRGYKFIQGVDESDVI